MIHPSTDPAGFGRGRVLAFVALVTAFGMLALAGGSKAAPVDHSLNADYGKLTLGVVFPDNTIIPAPVMGSHCPTMQLVNPPAYVPPPDPADCGPSPLSALVPNYPDGNAHIKVTVDGTAASVQTADFRFPMVYVPNPTDPGQMVPITASVPNGLTGTWDAGTGALSLTGNLRISIATGATGMTPADISWCQIDAPNVTWSTGLNAVTPGIPFDSAQGLDGNGAISAQWADLPNGVEINGGDCSTVNTVIHSTGAIWLGVGESTPPPPPACEPPLEGLWPDCVPTHVPAAKITSLRLTPKNRTVKAGHRVKLKVKVTNRGDAGGKVTVRLNLKKRKGVKLARRVRLNVKAGSTATRPVAFRTTSRARGRYRVVAVGQGIARGRKASSTITVKKAGRKKQHRRAGRHTPVLG